MVLNQQQKQTVQQLPDAQKNERGIEFFGFTRRGPLLPARATRERERVLFNVYYYDYNWMVQGAFAGIANVVALTPRQVVSKDKETSTETKYWKQHLKAAGVSQDSADSPKIEYFNTILEQADFGRGWKSFVKKVALNYLRHDCGAFVEIIAPGNPLKEPTGPVSGVAVLDSLRCIPTGDPEYPVIYYDRYNKYHLLHRARVRQIVDMPDTDEYHPGYGLCALSRAISITTREQLMGRYIEANLDDKPPPGLVVAKGMTKQERDKALGVYNDDMSRDEMPPWGRQLWFYAADPSLDIRLDVQSFTQAPEKFDFRTYTEIDVDALALAIGVDRQDLWQLTGGALGSGAQSEMLSQKSRGKTIGNLRDGIEQTIDDILPEGVDFEMQYKDSQEETEQANQAKIWAGVFKDLAGTNKFSDDELRMMLADKLEVVKEAITDESGTIQSLTDVQPQAEVVNTGQPPPPNAGTQPNTNANVPGQGGLPDAAGTRKSLSGRPRLHADLGGFGDSREITKAIQSTVIDFEDAFADLIDARVAGEISGLRFGIVARDLLRVYGLQALRDGLEAGGVPQYDENGIPVALDPDDQAAYQSWLFQQSAYVTDFGRTLTKGAAIDGEARAQLWVNKSIMLMFDTGRLSADRNGMYEFAGDDGEESCKTCIRLKGQIHRFKDWERKRLRPGVDTDSFICGGWNCQHKLVKTTERARGRF